MIDRAEADGPSTVKIYAKDPPQPMIPFELASGWHSILPKKYIEMDGGVDRPERMVGTGPFIMQADSNKDNFTKSSRNPNYFREDAAGNQLPYLDNVTTLLLGDVMSVDAAFRTKKIDMTDTCSSLYNTPTAENTKKDLGADVVMEQGYVTLIYLGFNHTKAPFNDIRARKAIHLAVDRLTMARLGQKQDGLLTGYYEHMGTPMDEVATWPGYGSPPREEDLAESRRLAEEVGLTECEIIFPKGILGIDGGAAILKQNLEKVGIKANLNVTDWPSMMTRASQQNFDIVYMASSAIYIHPDAYNSIIYLPTGGRNLGKWQAPQNWMDLYDKQKMLDFPSAERLDIIKQMEVIMRDEWLPTSLINFPPIHMLRWPYMQDYHWVGVPPCYNNQKWERVWCLEGRCAGDR
jgi:peptide/nickel transport system substrate-binding protein